MKWSKWGKIVVAILLAAFAAHQLYASLYNPITTESASFLEYIDGLPVTGLVLRNESLIERNGSGVLHFNVSDTERVAKDGCIADLYTTEQDSLAVAKIASLKEQVKGLTNIQNYNDLAAVDLDLLGSKITDNLSELLFLSGNDRMEQVSQVRDDLLIMMNRKEMITGGSQDFSGQIAALNDQIAVLEAQLHAPFDSIRAANSGFFVSATDGYETVLTVDDLSRYTPEMLDHITPAEKGDVVGKIVADYTWYIAANLDSDRALFYKPGDTVRLKTNLKSNPELTVTVETVNKGGDGRGTVVFSCREMGRELAQVRTLSLTIVEGDYQGLKVPRSALRFVDGAQGVYVISGMELKFVKVNVLFSSKETDFVICEKGAGTDSSSLRLYDKVVSKGKNLYDGKIIN